MRSTRTLTRSLLLGVAALSLQAAPMQAMPLKLAKPQTGLGLIANVAMDVGALQQRLAAAQEALADAQANGGDVAAAQAEVDAAQAELDAAMAADQQAPAEEPQPEAAAPEEAAPPEAEPAPEPEASAPEPQAEPAPAEEAPAQEAAPAEPAPEAEPAEPAAEAPAEPAPEAAPTEEAPEAAPADEAPKAEAPAEEPAPEVEAPAAETSEPAEAEAPAVDEAPVPEEQMDPEPGKQSADEVQPPADSEAPVPEASPDGQPLPEDGPTPATADDSAQTQAPAEGTEEPAPPKQVEAEPMSEEELQQAKEIAEDPSKTDETVILPVEKGAAVLDSEKEFDQSAPQTREMRRKERAASEPVKVPESDAAAQASISAQSSGPVELKAATAEEGRRVERRPRWERPDGAREREGDGNRIIIQFDNRTIVRSDDNDRFLRDSQDHYYEELPHGRVRETIIREDGTQVVTIRNRYGEIIQRSRIDRRGREYVLFYAPEMMDDRGHDRDRDWAFHDPGRDLPPMRLGIPVRDYIIDTSSDPDRDYYDFLEQPPVEQVERVYSLDEVKYSARIRDKVRRIDLDTVTFATGSAEIPMSQARTLRRVADAIAEILDKNPAETFLIEGHTDAVGSDESNLVLSDERAESVANLMTDVYGIPPENLATQGYGERYLKVRTLAASQENRRVTIRRVTPLVRPVASNQ